MGYWEEYEAKQEWIRLHGITYIRPGTSAITSKHNNTRRHITQNAKAHAVLTLSCTLESLAEDSPDAFYLQFLNNYEFGPYSLDIFFPHAMLAVEVGKFHPVQQVGLAERFIKTIEVTHLQALKQSYGTALKILAAARKEITRLTGFSKKASMASLQPPEQSGRGPERHGRSPQGSIPGTSPMPSAG